MTRASKGNCSLQAWMETGVQRCRKVSTSPFLCVPWALFISAWFLADMISLAGKTTANGSRRPSPDLTIQQKDGFLKWLLILVNCLFLNQSLQRGE